MYSGLEAEFEEFKIQFDEYSNNYFLNLKKIDKDLELIWDSVIYSFSNGGKRFRPFLIYLMSKVVKVDFKNYLDWAVAIEMIHTYSLIHDDLPCMDNDSLRRGLPTNHIRFGEDIALLAGDALQAQAFSCIVQSAHIPTDIKVQLIDLLSKNMGALGMVGGQVLDMKSKQDISLNQLEKIHLLKTSKLIQAAVYGSLIISKMNPSDEQILKNWADQIGLAFQIKDDLLDYNDKDQDFKSYTNHMGFEQTQVLLKKLSQQMTSDLNRLSFEAYQLVRLTEFNFTRLK